MQPRDIVNGRFEIDRLAGSGGMGSVYRAVDRHTGAPVAVKVIRGYSPEGMERFAREGEVLADLSHPGIVRFVASGVTPEAEPFLVMEWLEGESLGDRLARGVLSVAETIDLGRRVAEALAVAHAHGVVHRDLKPGNIFLPGRDLRRPKILDFGIARLVEGGSALTRTGMTLGSPGYVSPEQARGERNLDPSSDVFSLACVLFTCLVGEPPFTGELLQMLMRVVMDPAPLASSRRPDVPPALEDVLQRMLAKAPAARPRDAAAVAAALATVAATADTALRSVAAQSASGAWVPSPSSRALPSLRAPVASTPTGPPSGPSHPLASAPPPSSLVAPVGHVAPHPQTPGRVPVILLAAGVGAFVALAAVAAVFFYLRTVALSAPIACGGLKCAGYTPPDPQHVDPMEALPAMTQLAQSVDKGAVFCDMILGGAVDGTVPIGTDLRAVTATITVRFGPAKGTHATTVSVLPGRLYASEGACTHPAPLPACTPRAAAHAAVASGVPRGTSASMVYSYEEASGGPMWEFLVSGHTEYLRRIDGRTCAIKFKPSR